MLYQEAKDRLDAVLDAAYPNDPSLEEYKKYYLELSERVTKAKLGCYEPAKNKIRVYGVGAFSPSQIMITCLHELAHHVDSYSRPTKSHGDSFWAVFKRLVCSALDIGVITSEDIAWYANASNASDKNKVLSIAYSYTPNTQQQTYAAGRYGIYVYDAYAIRDHLKGVGFKYHAQDKSWHIELEQTRVQGCQEYLLMMGVDPSNIVVKPASQLYVKGI